MDAPFTRLWAIPIAHPRLHLTAGDVPALRIRAGTTHSLYAARLLQWVEQNGGWSPPTDLPDAALNEVILEECGAFVTNAALASLVTGELAHRDLARRWALAMCDLPHGDLQNYGLGPYVAGLARTYDWLFDVWTDEERDRIRGHTARLTEQLHRGSFPDTDGAHWWAGAHLHHDFWIPVGGFGEAALALLGEVDDAATWAARAWDEFQTCFSWLGSDGAWHEGAGDWCYALAPLLWFYGAWQSVIGEDPHDIPWLRNTAPFRLAHRLPDGTYLPLDDSFRSGRYNTSGSAACHLLRRLAALYRDGAVQWLAEQDEPVDLGPSPKGVYQAPYEGSSYSAQRTEYPHTAAHCAAWNLLWHDPSVTPAEPRIQAISHFPDHDLVLMRRGDAVVSFTCGPLSGHNCAERTRAGEQRSPSNFSHAHADFGSFTLHAGGSSFIVPPGYARRSSRFQNVVCVNGADFPPDPALDVRVLDTSADAEFTCAVGDATAAFLPELGVERWCRYLVLLDGCLLVYDDLRLASNRHRQWRQFEWRLHADPVECSVHPNGTGALFTPVSGGAPTLRLDVLAPTEFAWERSEYTSTTGDPLLECLRLVRPEWYEDRIQVLAAFSWDGGPGPALDRGDAWVGARWRAPARPVIAFAEKPGVAPGRSVLLFGADEKAPAQARGPV